MPPPKRPVRAIELDDKVAPTGAGVRGQKQAREDDDDELQEAAPPPKKPVVVVDLTDDD